MVFPSASFHIPTAIAVQPETTTMYFLRANSSTISARSRISGKFEQPTKATTPGMVPRVVGAPPVLISVSIMGPRPALIFQVSLLAPPCMIFMMGRSRGHSSSHLPQPTHKLNISFIVSKLPLATSLIPLPISNKLGHTCSHIPQRLHFWASSVASCSVIPSFLL